MFAHSSSFAVAATLWLLLAFSVATWALMVAKATQFIRSATRNRSYLAVVPRCAESAESAAEMPTIAAASRASPAVGFGVLRHQPPAEGGDDHACDRHELLERNLKQQVLRERRTLETGLAVLASVGSTAPFVGLFGTVWGIMIGDEGHQPRRQCLDRRGRRSDRRGADRHRHRHRGRDSRGAGVQLSSCAA